MKKLIYGGLFLALVGISTIGCKKSIDDIQPREQQKEIGESTGYEKALWPKIKVKLKHTAKFSPTGPPPSPCGEPFWACLIFGVTPLKEGEIISADERNNNIAAMQLELIDNEHLKLIPDAQMADNNNIFKLTGDMALDSETAIKLGFENVTLKEGTYTLDIGDGEFGSVIVDISH